jgi:hypothetical protein
MTDSLTAVCPLWTVEPPPGVASTPGAACPVAAFPIWGDSKWAEFFIYDVYTALARPRWAADVAEVIDRNSDAFPPPGRALVP